MKILNVDMHTNTIIRKCVSNAEQKFSFTLVKHMAYAVLVW